MKLKQAPMICHQFDPGAPWLVAAAQRCRVQYDCTPGTEQDQFGLRKLDVDIWAINGPLSVHRDKTRKGFQVFGLVLINEPDLMLYQGDAVWSLPVGSVYHLHGRKDHAALARDRRTAGLFGFMAWDVDRNSDLAGLLSDVPAAMQAYANGENRVDVSLDG